MKPNNGIDRGGCACVTYHGRLYSRETSADSEGQWVRRTPAGWVSVSESWVRRLEEIYRHPERYRLFRRYVACCGRPDQKDIESFFDIPSAGPSKGKRVAGRRSLFQARVDPGYRTREVPTRAVLMSNLAAAVSSGGEFLRRATSHTMVLILDRDNPEHIVSERREIFKMVEGYHLRIWGALDTRAATQH